MRMGCMYVCSCAAGDPHFLCVLAGGRGGWVVWGTMNPSPSTDRQYIDFNRVFQYKDGTYAAGTKFSTRYLRAGTRYKIPWGELFGTGTYVRYLIHHCFTI